MKSDRRAGRRPARPPLVAAFVALAVAGLVVSVRKGRSSDRAASRLRYASRRARNLEVARLGGRVGRTYASTAARKLFASSERSGALDHERELRTAADIAASLGGMKGALMKVGQMASYLDEGLPEPLRAALGELLAQAPPMSPELAA
ncbi:MAG TPA: hypothetical protein VFP08_12690, partial [Acidimicrobiales bacterium]|nr:hypothetical protein [Acidimicrobiales bacterium]